jgi:hypothetical protein
MDVHSEQLPIRSVHSVTLQLCRGWAYYWAYLPIPTGYPACPPATALRCFTPAPIDDLFQGYPPGCQIQQFLAGRHPSRDMMGAHVDPHEAIGMAGRFSDFVRLVP